MKRIMTMLMAAMLMVSMAVAPANAVVDIKPGNGGEWVDNTPGTPFPGTGGTTSQPTQPIDNSIKIYVNGIKVTSDVAPYVDSVNRTQAPFRAIGEALGCQVTWVNGSQQVICEKEGFKVEMTIGKKTFSVNGVQEIMDTVPIVKNNRTFIPVRYLAETLNCNVAWDQNTNTVTITSK